MFCGRCADKRLRWRDVVRHEEVQSMTGVGCSFGKLSAARRLLGQTCCGLWDVGMATSGRVEEWSSLSTAFDRFSQCPSIMHTRGADKPAPKDSGDIGADGRMTIEPRCPPPHPRPGCTHARCPTSSAAALESSPRDDCLPLPSAQGTSNKLSLPTSPVHQKWLSGQAQPLGALRHPRSLVASTNPT